METKELVRQAVENLQRQIAQSIKEDMPERSPYQAGVYYFGDATLIITTSGKSACVSIDCKNNELLAEVEHLHKAELYVDRDKLQRQIDKINKELGEVEK